MSLPQLWMRVEKNNFLQLIDQIKNHKIIIIVSHDNAILNTCDEILIL